MTSIEILQNIEEALGTNWKKELDLYIKEEDLEEDKKELFSQFFSALKEDTIEARLSNLHEVEKMINNDLLYESVTNYVDDILSAYNAIAPLRAMEIKDGGLAQKIVDCVFDENILRYNPYLYMRYEEYELLSEDVFIDITTVLSSMCTFLVSQNSHYSIMEKFIYDHTRLSKKLCRYIADKINDNFEKIQMCLIMDKLYD